MIKNNQQSSEECKVIHYIVVVHGIGEQRKNETILPVIEQFAAARHNNSKQKSYLTLGQLTSQSKENLWIEYQNIPAFPDPDLKNKPWIPILEKNSQGKNLRFVDFCWSNVTRKSHEKVGESTKVWTDSLINRLKLRVSLEPHNKSKKEQSTQWMVDMMETMQNGMLFVEKILKFRLSHFSNEIFGEFLGDVEMYADFPHTRGRAVRLFHETMAKVHEAHLAEFKDKNLQPHYTIIAHSLGTVLTMDAIAYAYANEQSRTSTAASSNEKIVHFPGYDNSLFQGETAQSENSEINPENAPNVDWVKFLHSYITLGSPIDKYLALWPENYIHFRDTDWMDTERIAERHQNKIQHFNYSDEQDPVGHELNILKSTDAWKKLAEIPEHQDILFNRYAYPGVAHVNYWKDNQLFSRILDLNIDNCDKYSTKPELPPNEVKETEKQEIKWFKLEIYIKALFISFILIPVTGWLISAYFGNTVVVSFLTQGLADFPLISFLFFFGTITLTHTLMKLLIEWRLVLEKSKKRKLLDDEKKQREFAQGVLSFAVIWSPIIWGVLFLGLLFFDTRVFLPEFLFPLLTPLRVGLFLAFLVSFDIRIINRKMNKKWEKNSTIQTEFEEYLKYLK